MSGFLSGFFSSWLIFAAVLGLQLALPARRIEGYARHEETGRRLGYRLNGLPVFAMCVAAWFVLGHYGVGLWADYRKRVPWRIIPRFY